MKTYKFYINVVNALDYLSDRFARNLDLSTNIISGFVKESMIIELRNHYQGLEINLIEIK